MPRCKKDFNTAEIRNVNSIIDGLQEEYDKQFNYMSVIKLKLLGDLWQHSHSMLEVNRELTGCVLATRMYHRDSFALSVFEALFKDEHISYKQALVDSKMHSFLHANTESLDGALAYLNGQHYLGIPDEIG